MSAREPPEPPEPDPERTPGLEPGGSVPPGDTPPESASATRGVSHRGDLPARAGKWAWLGVIALVVVLVALLFAFFATGLLT